MKFRSLTSLVVWTVITVTVSLTSVADDPIASPNDVRPGDLHAAHNETAIDRMDLFQSLEKSTEPSSAYPNQRSQSLADLKQARALDRANSRAARVDYNAWIGRNPLRPSWNATPMTSTRYAPRVVYVPVYVYGR